MLIEARIGIERDAAEAWADALAAHGDARFSVYEDVDARRAWVSGYFESEALANSAWGALSDAVPKALRRGDLPRLRTVSDADWRESYKAHFKAWRFDRLHWVPEWERGSHRLPRGHVAVYLDPGMAFGTGNHETTRLCVKRLVEYARMLSPRRRTSAGVIDAGCGSGILAISAVKLGFRGVFAFDNDREAVAIARRNARRNAAGAEMRVAAGGVAGALRRRRADLLLANIQANVLIDHAAVLAGAVAPGGLLVLSGILAGERDGVRRVFAGVCPAAKISSRRLGEWSDVCVSMSR